MFEPGVSDSLRDLLAIEKKSELKRYAKKLIINGAEFVQLTFYSRLIGYQYTARHTEFQPDEAQLTDRDLDILRLRQTDKIPKLRAKIGNLFATRKYLSAHLFYKETKWHLFYFTFRDTDTTRLNRWKHSSHVHFVNYLWPDYRVEQLDDLLFSHRHTNVNSIHIRFVHPSRGEGEVSQSL
jgi:hypothetical protein